MPIYDYICKKCGEKFDLRRGFFQIRGLIKCPKCGSDDAERVNAPLKTPRSAEGGCFTGHFG